MKVYTEVSYDGVVTDAGRVVALVRRVGTTVGLVFGFGLLALVMASHASAEGTQQNESSGQQHAEGSLLGVLEPVTGAVSNVLSPVTDTISDTVAPVAQPVARVVEPITESIVGPVLQPVVESVVAPVLAPVVDTVTHSITPVLDAVAPVTEPLVGPLLHAVDPVVQPVSNAVGPREEVSPVTGSVSGERQNEPGSTVPQDTSLPLPQPAPLWVEQAETAAVPVWTVRSDAYWVADVGASVASGHSMQAVGPHQPDPVPSVPFGPADPIGVAPGGNGSVGGFGGAHSGDAAVSTPNGQLANNASSGRGPPGTIVGHSWLGYAQPDCPS